MLRCYDCTVSVDVENRKLCSKRIATSVRPSVRSKNCKNCKMIIFAIFLGNSSTIP